MSIVVPCYCEEDALPSFYNEMKKIYPVILKEYDFEILFVDDGSTDDTLINLRELVSEDEHISYLSLSRNFGLYGAMLFFQTSCISRKSYNNRQHYL